MGNLKWNEILDVDSTSLKNDEDKAEEMFGFLAEANIDVNSHEVKSQENVIQLFKVTQAVMLVKHIQYETAVELFGNQMKDSESENEALRKELAHYQKYSGAGDKYLKSEMAQLEEKNKVYEKELEDLDRKLVKEQNRCDSFSKQCEELDLKNTDLKREVDRLAAKIKDYQRQLESQRETSIMRQGVDMNVKDQISKKNREISSYIDEIRGLQDENDKLQRDIQVAELELKNATSAMNTIADDYGKLKSVLADTDAVLEDMRQDRELLRSQVQDLNEQLQSKDSVDNEVMVAFKKKVEEWEAALVSKDEEVSQLNSLVYDLQRQLQAARMDTEKNMITDLVQANREKDEKIEELKKSLEEASKEMEAVTNKIEEAKSKAQEDGRLLRQQAKINTLNQTLQKEQMTFIKEKEQIQKLEIDIIEKEKVISELRGRMMQYEMGQFGLPEAVQEIKEFRAKIKARDKTIEDVTQSLNHVQMELDDYMLENEELRGRLGMDPKERLDSKVIRKKKQVKEEQTLALNRVLAKEVERLEEERQQLKKMLRKQAMHRGERAVELGLATEDLVAVEEAASQLDSKPFPTHPKSVYTESLSSQPINTVGIEGNRQKLIDKLKSDSVKIETKNKELREENKQLEIGLREILAMIKDNRFREENEGKLELSIPALEKLIAMIESRNAEGNYDTNIKLKAEIEQVHGRNDELRLELQKSRSEINEMVVQLERKQKQLEEFEKEVLALRDSDQEVVKLNPFALMEGIPPSSREIIASLNEFLVQILQELANREEILKQTEESLETYRRKFSISMHQQGLLYSQYLEEKEHREAESKRFREESRSQELIIEQDQIKLQEFDRMVETLRKSPESQKAKIAEYARKITVLRVNEKSLSRRYTILSASEEQLRKECSKLRDDFVRLEGAVTERIGYLTRYKEMATFRTAALQKALDESIPDVEMQVTNKKYNELTSKYRDLLQKENAIISRSTTLENLQFEVKRYKESDTSLRKELQSEKEKYYTLEQSMNVLLKKVGDRPKSLEQEEVTSIARQLATLEMKELNERQRAEHAVRKQQQMAVMASDLENRNNELEQKFSEITKINLELQRVERELREELCNAVPAEINRADKNRVKELEEKEAEFRFEISRLKEVAEIATHQADTIAFRQQVQEKEVVSLRRQLHDIQMETDEKTIIAKLHQQIITQQVSEATAVRKLEATTSKVKKLEASVLRIEQQLDEKDQLLYRVRMEARAKSRFLQKTIQDLRRQFSGSIPLVKQEKLAQTLRGLQSCKVKQDLDLSQAMVKRNEAENKAAELELKLAGLQELIGTLKDFKGAEKVAEWHNRIGEIRLQNMKLRRQIETQDQRIKYLEDQNRRLEESISLAEDENFKQTKEYEDRQLVWEQHEVELERKIARLEKNQDELFDAAQKFEEATGSYVDPNLPVVDQLEMAVAKLKEHIRVILVTRAENKKFKEESLTLEKKLQDKERKIASKDKLINELRLRIPISERSQFREDQDMTTYVSPEQKHAENALQIAQSTVDSLKIMVNKKDDTISKYQEMLAALRKDMMDLEDSHKHEIKVMQDQLHMEMEEKVKKLKAMHLEYINIPQPKVPSEQQLNRLADLEEIVAEQDKRLADSRQSLDRAKNELENIREANAVELKLQRKKLRLLEEEHKGEIDVLNRQMDEERLKVKDLYREVEILRDDLLAAKEANEKAPTRTMKTVIEKLRNQLALKEKQQKALSQALLKLRADMVSQAEDDVKSNAKRAEDELNIQKIVEKHTSALEAKIEELEESQSKHKEQMRKKLAEGDALRRDLENVKQENQRKDAVLKKLAMELKEKENLNDQVEDLKSEIKTLEKSKLEVEKLCKRLEVAEEEKISAVESGLMSEGAKMDFEQNVEPTKDQTSRSEVIRWEEGKKWQKKVENLKVKLKDKIEEVEKLENSNRLLKEAVQRNEKERASLQSRIKSISRADGISRESFSGKDCIVHSLKSRIFQLEEENNDLQRRIAMEGDLEIQELRIKNGQLLDTIKALEKELSRSQVPIDSNEHSWSVAREQSLQKDILQIRKENMDLKFERDRALANIPRLQGRVKDLEEYCEILKAELDTLKSKEKIKKSSMATGLGGQSVEDMERVIAAMRRVIERLQGENDSLKKQRPKNVTSSEASRENRQLKQEIQSLKSRDRGALSSRGSAISKINNANEKIRKELQKCMADVDKLKINNTSLLMEKENLAKELEESKRQLAVAEARMPKLSEADSKQWNSVLMTKMSEEKVAQMQTDLDKKVEHLEVVRSELKSALGREAELQKTLEELKSKVSLLERFPSEIKLDSELVQKLQKARLRINTLEAEKVELLDDVSRLRQIEDGDKTTTNMDEVLDKLKKYDALLEAEVELRTELGVTKLEKEKLAADNRKLRRELDAFDPSFFEELEDLKYNYKKSVERNVLYERQLRNLSRQFGVQVQIETDGSI